MEGGFPIPYVSAWLENRGKKRRREWRMLLIFQLFVWMIAYCLLVLSCHSPLHRHESFLHICSSSRQGKSVVIWDCEGIIFIAIIKKRVKKAFGLLSPNFGKKKSVFKFWFKKVSLCLNSNYIDNILWEFVTKIWKNKFTIWIVPIEYLTI